MSIYIDKNIIRATRIIRVDHDKYIKYLAARKTLRGGLKSRDCSYLPSSEIIKDINLMHYELFYEPNNMKTDKEGRIDECVHHVKSIDGTCFAVHPILRDKIIKRT